MVIVRFCLKSNYAWVSVKGHCGYSLRNRLVCASLSTLVQSLWLGLKDVLGLEVCGIIRVGRARIFLKDIPTQKKNEVNFAFITFIKSIEILSKEYKCIKILKRG